MKLGLKTCFVNNQLTYVIKKFSLHERKLPSKPALSNASFGVLEVKKCCVYLELQEFFYVQTLLYAIYYRYIVKCEYRKTPVTLNTVNNISKALFCLSSSVEHEI